MSDRIAVFNDAVIQQLDAPAELYEQPQNAFVARLIGENNRLHGKVVAMKGSTCKLEVAGAGNVQALEINVGAVGRPIVLSLRPERVQLNLTLGALPNVFSARVAEVIELSDNVRTRVSVCCHDDFVNNLPNSEGLVQLDPGTAITIGWKTENCRALDARDDDRGFTASKADL